MNGRLEAIKAWRHANRERVLAHKRRYYQRHKAQHAQWKQDNKDKVKASYARHAVKRRAQITKWKNANRERVHAYAKKTGAKSRSMVTDAYVRKLVARHDGWNVARILPPDFIETKRVLIQLKRLCQKYQT